MEKASIIDASRPNAGRVYDHLLGGHHNFEVDRQAADQLVKVFPFLPKAMRLQRWCLQDLAEELTGPRGFDVIVDFASGLPTNDHIHHVVPPGTRVIYSDNDPVVVEYAHEILKDTPNVYFFQSDAGHPEELLNRAEVQTILEGRRDVALVYWGISAFLSDAQLSHAAQALYAWAGETSCWAFNGQGANADPNGPGMVKLLEIYRNMGSQFRIRSTDEYLALLKPWHPDAQGFMPFIKWHALDPAIMSKEDLLAAGPGGGGYGVYLVK